MSSGPVEIGPIASQWRILAALLGSSADTLDARKLVAALQQHPRVFEKVRRAVNGGQCAAKAAAEGDD